MTISFADRLKHVGEYYFSQKLEEIRQMRLRGLDVISLGIGSPDLMPPQAVVESAAQALWSESSHGYASYRSSPELRQAMSHWYKGIYKVDVDAETQVLPLLGSKEGILYVSMAFLNPGDSVLVPNPGYPAYSSVAALIGVNVIYYDLTEENGWFPDFSKLERLDLARCKLMWTNYPHMPTGTSSNPELLKKLVAFGKNKNIFICNDNPYGLVLNREAPLSILSVDPKMETSGELNSLSKSFNMAGWRVGMLMASGRVIDATLQVKSNVDSGMFLPIQKGAAQALSAGSEFHEDRNRIYEERRKVIWKIFDQLGFTYSTDQVGLFVWAKAPERVKDVPEYVDRILQMSHVFLVPGFIFGSNGKRHARASLCAPQAKLEKALKRIEVFYIMKVAIVGLGLIGGSLALELKAKGFASQITGVDASKEHIKQAKELKLVDETLPLDQAIASADLVVLAVPVSAVHELLPDVLSKLPNGATLTDMGSTKEKICERISTHPKRSQFVASHPMAGTEFSGPIAAIRGLFAGKAAVICESEKSGPPHLKLIEQMYASLQMRVTYMKASEHDLHTAYVSHLSHISSFVLANTILEKEKDVDTIFDLASGGFESTVRLAKSSPEMWAPIFEQNQSRVSEALGAYIEHLQDFRKSLDTGNFSKTKTLMERANQIRRVLSRIGSGTLK